MVYIPFNESDFRRLLEDVRSPEQSKETSDTDQIQVSLLEYQPCKDCECCASIELSPQQDELGRRLTTR